MIAAIATIVFLIVASAAVVALYAMVESSLPKISAALRGQSGTVYVPPVAIRVSPRYPQANARRARARPAMRAAA